MHDSHDHRLIVLSILVSILGAYASRDLFDRVRDARGRVWLAWLVGGATADGIGTWSMHYTAMLGVHLPVPVLYDWPTVVLSLLASILGSGAALLTLRSGKIDWPRTLLASLFMGGAGISGLHYVAMAAMRLQGAQHYSPVLVTLSVASAVAICWMALTRNSIFRADTVGHRWRTHASAVLRGSANPVMHYIAMAALTFTPSDQIPNLSHAVSIQSLGVIGISVVPVMLLVVVLLTSLADRLQKERALLDELFEQAPQAVALLSADNLIVRVNSEFTRLFGYSE